MAPVTRYTFCRICEAKCGLAVTVEDNRVVHVAPDKENPYSWRDFCVKGRTAHELIDHPRRIRSPMKRVGEGYVAVEWDDAIQEIAAGLSQIINAFGPDAVAFYSGNPWAFNGVNPAVNIAFMDALGSHNRYNVGGVDHNAHFYVNERMYGRAFFTLVPDVDRCRCFLFVGMNPAESAMNWIGNVPNGWRRILDAQKAGADLIVVDPRRTPTAERADLHLATRPGTDWALLLGVVKAIFDHGWQDEDACQDLTHVEELRALVASADLQNLGERCEMPVSLIEDVARRFSAAPTAMCIARTGTSQTIGGTAAEWLSQVLNHITGRIDVPGGRYTNPGYVDLSSFDDMIPVVHHLSRVRGLPMVSGFHTIAELPDEILTPGDGQIRALIMSSGNPVVTGPNGTLLDHALSTLELLVAHDLLQRESHRHAHWLIPAPHFLEREDLLPVNGGNESEPFAQFAFRVVEPPEGMREEHELFLDLAAAMGRPLFDGHPFDAHEMYRQMLATSGKVTLDELLDHPHGFLYGTTEFGHMESALATSDHRVDVAPAELVADVRARLASSPDPPDLRYPLCVISRRRVESMNSWTNDLPSIHRRLPSNTVEMNSVDASAAGVADGEWVQVESPVSSIELRAVVSDAVRPGVVVCEHGWGSRVFDPSSDGRPLQYGANRNLLVDNTVLDPLSQAPAMSGQRVSVRPAEPPGPEDWG